MNFLDRIPTDLINVIISFLDHKDIYNFYTILPYKELVDWSMIGSYTFNINFPKSNEILMKL